MEPKDKTIEDLLVNIVKVSTRKVSGRFNCKELKDSTFISNVFKSLTLTIDKEESPAKIRCELQKIIEDNKRSDIGRFHSVEVNEAGLINDMIKKFNITIK